MKTSTESLVGQARLTPQERGQHLHSLRAGGAVFVVSLGDAQLSKALWEFGKWLDGFVLSGGNSLLGPSMSSAFDEGWMDCLNTIKKHLLSDLKAHKIERPDAS